MTAILIFLSFCIGIIGAACLSQATYGVGLICFACLIAIFARIVQAQK